MAPQVRMMGHGGTIRALAYSPDGATLATAGEDGEVKLWDTVGGRQRVTLTGHSDMVNALAFSPAGRTLATASLDSTVKLWDVLTLRERDPPGSFRRGVVARVRPRGPPARHGELRRVGAALGTGCAPSFVPTACFAGPAAVQSVAFGRDGRALLALGRADVLAGWDVRTGAVLGGAAIGVAPRFTAPAGKPVDAIASLDGGLHVRDTATGRDRFVLRSEGCRTFTFSPEGQVLATGHADGEVLLWDARSGRQLAVLKGHHQPVKAIAFCAR